MECLLEHMRGIETEDNLKLDKIYSLETQLITRNEETNYYEIYT